MKRSIGGVALLAPLLAAGVGVAAPAVVDGLVPAQFHRAFELSLAAAFGIWLAAVTAWLFVRIRLGGLAAAAEGIAAGDYAARVGAQAIGVTGRLGVAIDEIAAQLSEAYSLATVDRLTGVASRQAVVTALFDEVDRANRYQRPLSVAFVDIDHFKQVNDTHGHHAGDVVLRAVAQTVRSNLRATDMVGRYGGEEFLLILTETAVDDATNLAEKLRTLIEREHVDIERDQQLGVTVSIGIAGGVGHSLRVDTLVRDADAAMYSAKALGRNQTYVFAEPDEDARVPRAPISQAGREAAIELGRAARDAAQAALTSVIAPLPHYRGQPSALIAKIAVTLGSRLELPEPEIEKLRIAALLHDLGKVALPEEILEKPGALTSAEWRTVVQHPRIGQVILEQATILREAVPIILHHHERFGGHGYPYGLRGKEIPLGARIVAIADAYDAMTHDRPYKRAMSHAQAIDELRRHGGTQFDPELVALFCELYAENPPEQVDADAASGSGTLAGILGGRPSAASRFIGAPDPERESGAAASG